MSNGVNKVILIGNLGADPEVKYLPNGNAVVNFTVATGESWKDKNTGQKVEKTEWHRVVAFRKLAEICGEYLHKGSKVYVEGKLQTEMYEKDGVKHYPTKIIANEMRMLDSRGDNQGSGQQQAAPQQQQQQAAPAAGPQDFDDDIPF